MPTLVFAALPLLAAEVADLVPSEWLTWLLVVGALLVASAERFRPGRRTPVASVPVPPPVAAPGTGSGQPQRASAAARRVRSRPPPATR